MHLCNLILVHVKHMDMGPNFFLFFNSGFYKQLPRACCGAPSTPERAVYNFNVTAKCGEPGATACADPTTHWSWDGIHLTEAAYRHIAKGWLYGPFADQPIVQSS
jgi:hypothetical protein